MLRADSNYVESALDFQKQVVAGESQSVKRLDLNRKTMQLACKECKAAETASCPGTPQAMRGRWVKNRSG